MTASVILLIALVAYLVTFWKELKDGWRKIR